jgi:hypothetical protein
VSDVKILSEVKRTPDTRVIEMLERLLARAQSGEVRGFVILLNCGESVDNYAVGDCRLTDVLAAFEDWKFSELAHRNLVCGSCGNSP